MVHNKDNTAPEITVTYTATSHASINYLPVEIHVKLCEHLDSISIKQFRLTDRTIRNSIGVNTIKKKIQTEIIPATNFLKLFGLSVLEEPIPGNDYLYRSIQYNAEDIKKLANNLEEILTDKLATYHLRKMSPFFNMVYKEYANSSGELPAKEKWHEVKDGHTWIYRFVTSILFEYETLHKEQNKLQKMICNKKRLQNRM